MYRVRQTLTRTGAKMKIWHVTLLTRGTSKLYTSWLLPATSIHTVIHFVFRTKKIFFTPSPVSVTRMLLMQTSRTILHGNVSNSSVVNSLISLNIMNFTFAPEPRCNCLLQYSSIIAETFYLYNYITSVSIYSFMNLQSSHTISVISHIIFAILYLVSYVTQLVSKINRYIFNHL